MRDFLSRHSYIIIWILSLLIIGSAAILIFELNAIVPTTGSISVVVKSPRPRPQPPATPPAPVVTASIEKTKTGNSFIVQWANLPDGTVALEIFRGKTGTDPSTWSLWKTISISSNELANGSAEFNLGSATEAGYSFFEEAVGGGGSGNSSRDFR